MRRFIFSVVFLVTSGLGSFAFAQQSVWVQIEAQRSLNGAQEVARRYAGTIQQISGFAMRSGWYAIAIGPFSPADAQDVLQQLRVTRQIPGDSYVVDGSSFGQQFWPIGAVAGSAPIVVPENPQEQETVVVQPLIPAEETVAQARSAERQLNREERMLLQTALKWEGFYSSAIDGAIGPGTRNSMAAWQTQEGFEPTGVLSTKQRSDLVGRYQEMLASLGIAPIIDNTAGIQIDLPTAMVTFDRYDPPFAHFKASDDDGVQVLLISQTGDEATLRGLYDIMQTLEIVPLNGPRKFGKRNFTLAGENSDLSSYTYAALADGHVKGFTVIWPGQSDRRSALVVNAMQSSFKPFGDAVLPDVYGDPNAAQSLDLLAGLDIRQPEATGSGFYVDSSGAILTAMGNVNACTRVTIDLDYDAQVTATDNTHGYALLRPIDALAPISVAQLLTNSPRINSEIALAGYSYGGLLGSPTLTYGTLADLRGLNGDTSLNRLAIAATSGDVGGPVFSAGGAVLGMLLPTATDSGQRLPDGVRFAAGSISLAEFLSANGVAPLASDASQGLAPEDLTVIAADMTVLVSCWN
ncbi:MAG: trypsin-like peptidase domain-containing protein [Paracoccaceae bacterium]